MGLLDDFLVRAALAGVGLAVAAAVLGCFVVWRRMAYFGDATAHASVLGVALSLGLGVAIFPGVLVVALAIALTVSALSGRGHSVDTMLGVLAHSALAIGLVAVSFLPDVRIDIMAYLFGDILAVSRGDLAVIWGGALVVSALIWWRWSGLLTATLNPDLAYATGYDPRREQLVLTVALALVVAASIKVVGALLIVAMLIIPPAAARPLARSPEALAIGAVAIGALSTLGGLWLAFQLDTPTGPTIVSFCAAIFALTNMAALLWGPVRR